jgi:sugar lactone lactonase YvrE
LSLAGTVTAIANSAAQFTLPVGVTSDGINLYVADSSRNEVRKIVIANGNITTVAGSNSAIDSAASVNGTGSAARFYHPEAITCDGSYLYVAERQSGLIRKVDTLTGAVTTMTTSAPLTSPAGITTDGVNLYVTDAVNHVIQKIGIVSGVVSTVAGTSGSPGSSNGIGPAATFNQPVGITTDGSSLFVNDFGNGQVRRIVIASGAVTTVASGFTTPAAGIATDGSTLYVADYSNSIRRVSISGGTVSTLTGPAAGFIHPEGLASDGRNLFVVDSGNHVILKMN